MGSNKDILGGSVRTVNGDISPDDMGYTLSHEHCLIDNTKVFVVPQKASEIHLAHEKLSLKNLGIIRYNLLSNKDNLLLDDEDLAIKELMRFKIAGGDTIVDAGNDDLGRDPRALKRISNATGLNIIMGSGYYVDIAQNKAIMSSLTENEITKKIISDIIDGVDETGICSGLIGEIGCSWPLYDSEKKVLRAAGIAQKETGAPLQIHPGRNKQGPFEILKILDEVGADITHTSICHIERTIHHLDDIYKLADTGCYLEYDLWGLEGYYPESFAVIDLPNDSQRIAQIKNLDNRGYGDKILLSYDICYKCRYFTYGGHGYGHIFDNIIPAMLRREINRDKINQLLIDNPKTFFTFR